MPIQVELQAEATQEASKNSKRETHNNKDKQKGLNNKVEVSKFRVI